MQIDSFYSLINELYSRDFFKQITIASRGITLNKPFFEKGTNSNLIGQNINSLIDFRHNWDNNNTHINIKNYDVIFLRIDQPVSSIFLENLKINNKNIIFINDPIGMIQTNNKQFLLKISTYTPKIKLANTIEEIIKESLRKEIVIKPLKSYGGFGISKISKEACYIENNLVTLTEFSNHINKLIKLDGNVLVMDYLKNVYQGDKRIIIINGEILGAILRIPSKENWICNLSQGATTQITTVTKEEIKIIQKINPILEKKGIILYGIDTLVDNHGNRVLSEINTANIGGFTAMEELYKKPIIPLFIDKLIQTIITRIK